MVNVVTLAVTFQSVIFHWGQKFPRLGDWASSTIRQLAGNKRYCSTSGLIPQTLVEILKSVRASQSAGLSRHVSSCPSYFPS